MFGLLKTDSRKIASSHKKNDQNTGFEPGTSQTPNQLRNCYTNHRVNTNQGGHLQYAVDVCPYNNTHVEGGQIGFTCAQLWNINKKPYPKNKILMLFYTHCVELCFD